MTFNHAPYIEDAMNGFCMQETTFPFVCTIMDDASTDGEPEVIKKYLQEHFDLDNKAMVRNEETDDYVMTFAQHKTNKNCYFAVYFLKYNHYSIKKSKIPYIQEWQDQVKYIALCEGDDYWIAPDKLPKQYDFLENHSEYVAAGCNYINVESDGSHPSVFLIKCETNKTYSLKHFLRFGFKIHGNSLLFRASYLQTDDRYIKLRKSVNMMGDIVTRTLLYDKGYIYVFREVMLAHRRGDLDKNSFYYTSLTQAIQYSYEYCRIVDALEEYFDGKYNLSAMKANRTGKMLAYIIQGRYKVDPHDLQVYMAGLPWNIRFLSFERCLQNIVVAFIRKIARRLKWY